VTGPIEAARTPRSPPSPSPAARLATVDDEVNVIALDREVDDAEGGLV